LRSRAKMIILHSMKRHLGAIQSACVLLGLLLGAACGGDDACDPGLYVFVLRASGFDLGEYHIDVVLDDWPVTVLCRAGADGLIDDCIPLVDPGMPPRYPIYGLQAVDEGFTQLFFGVNDSEALCVDRADMPQTVSVTVRRGEQILGTEVWQPDYRSCRTDTCRRVYNSVHELHIE